MTAISTLKWRTISSVTSPTRPASARRKNAPGDDHLDAFVGGQYVGNVQVIGHHHQVAMLAQRAGHRLGRGADVQEYRCRIGDLGRDRAPDPVLRLGVQGAAFLIADVGHARRQHRAAIDPRQLPRVAQVGQVAPDGLQGDAKVGGQVLDHHRPPLPRDPQDLRMPKRNRHTPTYPAPKAFQSRIIDTCAHGSRETTAERKKTNITVDRWSVPAIIPHGEGETPLTDQLDIADLFVIGGGINGCGIARDAVGRGLSVVLAEKDDLAQATSSASTKLFHGGLRYLEFFEFRLVKEALVERETLLRAMPHISWPMRFVLPFHPSMRFDSETPTSRLLSRLMPWMKGRRPAWLIRLGLLMYDTLGGRKILPATSTLDLRNDPAGAPLDPKFTRAYEYSDCWVEDSRLVVLNARDAEARGARILTRCEVTRARRDVDHWAVDLTHADGRTETVRARGLVNAGGPWVGQIIGERLGINSREKVRLVRGSHIVTRRLYDHDKCYFFQGTDGRIIFAIPYETDFTLIGTTDQEHKGSPSDARCTEAEQDYLCDFASRYFRNPVTRDDIVWTYSGVRPLYDDGAKSATAATRDYVLSLDTMQAGPAQRLRRQDHDLPEARAGGAGQARAALPCGHRALDGRRAAAGRRFSGRWRRRADRRAAKGLSVPDRIPRPPPGPRLRDRGAGDAGCGQIRRRSGPRFRRHPDRAELRWLMDAGICPNRRGCGVAQIEARPAPDDATDRRDRRLDDRSAR
jgi:glycine/D-amino acid oxidase-like deaminating enzyme